MEIKINKWLYDIIYIIIYCILMVNSFIMIVDKCNKYCYKYPNLCDASMFFYLFFVVISIEFVIFDLVTNYTFNKIKK